jgi:hypothetical protein
MFFLSNFGEWVERICVFKPRNNVNKYNLKPDKYLYSWALQPNYKHLVNITKVFTR